MKIDFANLQYQYQLYKSDIDTSIQKVLNKSNYIMGEEISELEEKLRDFTGAGYAISCSSGTDALLLALMAMDIQPGDEIITTPFTFIATAETIALMKAVPVFVDIEAESFNIDAAKIEAVITDKTKAIIPVSLYGQPPDLGEIRAIAQQYNLKVIIDGAQSFGATYQKKKEVNYCDIYTTSFFPAKPFGCYGDGGAVFTNNEVYADKIKMMRIHGQNQRYHHKYVGIGGRLDTIQAAVLLAKLPHYENELNMRQQVAEKYTKLLASKVKIPVVKADRTSVWAQYTVRVNDRDVLQQTLKQQGIPTAIHYPMSLHQQECFQYLRNKIASYPVTEKTVQEVISLPMNPFVTDEEIEAVTSAIDN